MGKTKKDLLISIDNRLGYLCQLMETFLDQNDARRFQGDVERQKIGDYMQGVLKMFGSHPAIKNDPRAQEMIKNVPNIGGSE